MQQTTDKYTTEFLFMTDTKQDENLKYRQMPNQRVKLTKNANRE